MMHWYLEIPYIYLFCLLCFAASYFIFSVGLIWPWGQRWCQQLRQKLYQGLDCFEPYNTDLPNGSSQSCCLFAIAIDRTCSAKQNDNWLELYELIVTYMAYHCYPEMWKIFIRYMEFIQPVQNNTSVYIILRSLLAVTSPSTEGLKLDFFMTQLTLMSFCSFVCRSAVLRKLTWYQMIKSQNLPFLMRWPMADLDIQRSYGRWSES